MKNRSLSLFFVRQLVLSKRSGALVRRISILSFLAISLSMAAFFIVLFVMNGMNANIRKRILALEPHMVTTHSLSSDVEVRAVVGDGSVNAYEKLDLILRTIDGQFRGAEAVGYNQEGLDLWMSRLRDLKEGNRQKTLTDFELSKLELGVNEVAIGIDLSRSMGLLEGDEITLIPPETLLLSSLETPLFQKVTVRRILTTDLYDLDSKLILFNSDLSLRPFSKTLSYKRGFHIWFDNVGRADSVQQQLLARKVKSETWQEKNSDLFFALLMEKTMIGTFLSLAGLIASSSILTVLALLMSQKKRDIAILKTLGLSQKKTLWLFTKMGLWISGGAILLGSVIGLGVGYYLQLFPVNILPNVYYDSSIPAKVDLLFAFIVMAVASSLAFLGSYWPARATYSIHPALLLRMKN